MVIDAEFFLFAEMEMYGRGQNRQLSKQECGVSKLDVLQILGCAIRDLWGFCANSQSIVELQHCYQLFLIPKGINGSHYTILYEFAQRPQRSLIAQPKGQLISKCPNEIIVSSKIPKIILLDFFPEIFLYLPGGFLGAFWASWELIKYYHNSGSLQEAPKASGSS